jgi:hypothetical protein
LNQIPETVDFTVSIMKGASTIQLNLFTMKEDERTIVDLDYEELFIVSIVPMLEQAQGVLLFNATGGISYTPFANFTGYDVYNYTVTDRNDTSSSLITFDVQNSPPSPEPGMFPTFVSHIYIYTNHVYCRYVYCEQVSTNTVGCFSQ